MKAILRSLALTFAGSLCAAGFALAQTAVTAPQSTAPVCAPTGTLTQFVDALDAAVSGPANGDRSCLRALALPGAQLIPLAKDASDNWQPHPLTVEDWITRVAQRGPAPFYEVQVRYSVKEYGQIAQIWSLYEIRETPTGKATLRGINAIQAIRTADGWKLSHIDWKAESAGDPIPADAMPAGK
ncbi:hypothetical protein GCM10011586_37110 [Silvibacterium dinghuense]|nr:hypothetical protein GCM10011586_37110 [Silvibacterium dinghuense]